MQRRVVPMLEAIRQADGLILGIPDYLGDVSAGFLRAEAVNMFLPVTI